MGLLSRKNKVITDGLAKLLDGPAALRRYLIETVVMQGVTLQDVLTDDDKLEALRAQGRSWGPARLLFMPDGVG